MSKNKKYIFTFLFTVLVLFCLWAYNGKLNKITELNQELKQEKEKYEELEIEYSGCKGEIFHKNKLLEMEKQKNNRVINKDSIG